MPYRTEVVDTASGPELFQTRLSREAFLGWLERRERLLAEGKPDRPPDVDAPTLEAWLPHPGEEDHPFFWAQAIVEERPATAMFPVAAFSWDTATARTVVTMTGLVDGGYHARVSESDPATGGERNSTSKDYPPVAPATEVADDFEGMLAIVCSHQGGTDKVSTPSDFADMERALQEAHVDIVDAFGALPDPGTDRIAVHD